jgi:hypothetical protein
MNAHGSFTLKQSGQILWSSCKGAWNEEQAKLFLQAYESAAIALNPGWASIMDLSEWQLGTPDIWPVIDELNRWLNKTGFAYDAIIVNSKIKAKLFERSTNSMTTAETRFFATVDEAMEWLRSEEIDFGYGWRDIDAA